MFVIHIGLITLDWWSILAQTYVALSQASDTYDVVFGLNLHFCFFFLGVFLTVSLAHGIRLFLCHWL
jgi:hypothetical protein